MRYNARLFGGIFFILLFIFLIIESPWSKRIRAPKRIKITDFKISDIAKIEMKSKDKEFILTKKDEKWFLQRYDTIFLPVDSARIDRTLKAFENLEGEVVGTNPKDFNLYQVEEENGIHIKAYNAKGNTLLDFFVGKMGPDFSSNYVRLNNKNEIVLVEKYIRGDFPLYKLSWIDKRLTNFKAEDVVKFKHNFGENFVVVKKDGRFYFENDTVKLDSTRTIQYLRMISNIIAMDIIDTISIKDAGLLEPAGIFDIEMKDGTYHSIIFGNNTGEGGVYYVTNKNKKYVYTLSKTYVDNALKKTKDYFLGKTEGPEIIEKPFKKFGKPKKPLKK